MAAAMATPHGSDCSRCTGCCLGKAGQSVKGDSFKALEEPTKGEQHADPEPEVVAVTTWDWLPPSAFRCPRCGTISFTRELAARCPSCGFTEGM